MAPQPISRDAPLPIDQRRLTDYILRAMAIAKVPLERETS